MHLNRHSLKDEELQNYPPHLQEDKKFTAALTESSSMWEWFLLFEIKAFHQWKPAAGCLWDYAAMV